MNDCQLQPDGDKYTCIRCGWSYHKIVHHNCYRPENQDPIPPSVGDFLHNILREEFNLDITTSCGCRKQIHLMNAWGPEGCRENIGQIVNHMLGEAKKRDWMLEGRPLLSTIARLGTKTPLGMSYARKWARDLVFRAIKLCEEQEPMKRVEFAVAVTTVRERILYPLPQTLKSLRAAGFDNIHEVIDSKKPMGIVGTWVKTLWALWVLNPRATHYIIFQDDILAMKNLREYLAKSEYPENGYCNLCTYPENTTPKLSTPGWHRATKRGKGAQALMFDPKAVKALLTSGRLVSKPHDARNADRSLDGMIVEAMEQAGYKEYVHSPSLVDHVGQSSTIGHEPTLHMPTFDETFDLLSLPPGKVHYP